MSINSPGNPEDSPIKYALSNATEITIVDFFGDLGFDAETLENVTGFECVVTPNLIQLRSRNGKGLEHLASGGLDFLLQVLSRNNPNMKMKIKYATDT